MLNVVIHLFWSSAKLLFTNIASARKFIVFWVYMSFGITGGLEFCSVSSCKESSERSSKKCSTSYSSSKKVIVVIVIVVRVY